MKLAPQPDSQDPRADPASEGGGRLVTFPRIAAAFSLACLAVLTTLASLVLLEARGLLRDVRADLAAENQNMGRAVDGVAQIFITYIKPVLDSWNTMMTAETERLNKATQEGQKVEAGVKELVVRADQQLNGDPGKGIVGLLPSAVRVLNQQNDELLANERNFDKNLTAMETASAQLQSDLASAGVLLADPQLKVILANLSASSADLAESMKHLNAMLESGQYTAADIQKVADKVAAEYTKTRNLAFALFKELLGMAGSAAQVVK